MVEEDMEQGFSLTAFAGRIGVCKATLTNWQNEHPEFLAAVTRAKSKRLRFWEERGLDVAKQGGPGGQSTMIIFGLKNMGGEEWADRSAVEHSGPNGGAIQTQSTVLDATSLTMEERQKMREILQAAAERKGKEGG